MADVVVRCTTCGKTLTVDFGYCLQTGWPKCHEATMPVIDLGKVDIEAETTKAIRAQAAGIEGTP